MELGRTARPSPMRCGSKTCNVSLPHWFVTNAPAMNLMTWATIATELAVGILVWFPRFRPWVLAAGVLLHLMIDVNIQGSGHIQLCNVCHVPRVDSARDGEAPAGQAEALVQGAVTAART